MAILATIAAALAPELAGMGIERGASWLRDKCFGDAEIREIRAALAAALQRAIEAIALEVVDDATMRPHLRSLFEPLVDDGVAMEALLAAALQRGNPPLRTLRDRFDALDYDAATLGIELDALFRSLTHEVADELLRRAIQHENPLHNRVSLAQLALLLHQSERRGATLEAMEARFAEIERLLVRLVAAVARDDGGCGGPRQRTGVGLPGCCGSCSARGGC